MDGTPHYHKSATTAQAPNCLAAQLANVHAGLIFQSIRIRHSAASVEPPLRALLPTSAAEWELASTIIPQSSSRATR